MKSNFYKTLSVAMFILAAAPTFAQFSAGVDLGIPTGDFSKVCPIGFGASARYEAAIETVDKLSWTASAGFLTCLEKKQTVPVGFVTDANGNYVIDPNTGYPEIKYGKVGGGTVTLIPVTGGAKYYFKESGAGAYGAADIGLVFGTNGFGTKFNFAPGIGYRLEKFDFTLRYNVVSNANYLGLRAAYIFGGK